MPNSEDAVSVNSFDPDREGLIQDADYGTLVAVMHNKSASHQEMGGVGWNQRQALKMTEDWVQGDHKIDFGL